MKNVLILNNRALDYYDFQELKLKHPLKIFCVVTENYYQKLSQKTKTDVDHFFILPPQSLLEPIPFPIEDVRQIIRDNFNLKRDYFFINCADEINLGLAARLREEFNLFGAKSALIKKFRHKSIQKAELHLRGIHVPKYRALAYYELKYKDTYKNLCAQLGIPFILKPDDHFGSVKVQKIQSQAEFNGYIAELGPYKYFSAEEFIEGRLYHCDLITQNNQTLFAQSSEYFFNGLSYINGTIHGSIPLLSDNSLNAQLIQYAEKVNHILGLENGCSHHELFVTSDRNIVYLESAARPPGSLVPLIHKNCFGINFLNASLELDCNLAVTSFRTEPRVYQLWSMFPSQSGVIKGIALPILKSKFYLDLFVKTKSVSRKSASLLEQAANLIAINSNYSDLYEDFAILKAHKLLDMDNN